VVQSLERDCGSVSSASMRFVIYTGSLTEIPKVCLWLPLSGKRLAAVGRRLLVSTLLPVATPNGRMRPAASEQSNREAGF
jgi:hypothetical protein